MVDMRRNPAVFAFMAVGMLSAIMIMAYTLCTDYLIAQEIKPNKTDEHSHVNAHNSPRKPLAELFPEIISPSNLSQIKNDMIQLAKTLHKARLHVRGTKTADNLREAIKIMTHLLNNLKIDGRLLEHRTTAEPKSVCPEIYKGPFYHTGFVSSNCTYAKPLPELVTILTYFKETSPNISQVQAFIESVYAENKDYKSLVALSVSQIPEPIKKAFPNVAFKTFKDGHVGITLNELVSQHVNTPYVLIARNVDMLTGDSRIERLVREIESLQIAVVAGAYRTPDGHWTKGCFQSVYRNFTLKYVEGYDESIHECIFCDYLTGPFVTSLDVLRTYTFSDISDEQGLFEDWFLRLMQDKRESVVCPDSMFHTRYTNEAKTPWDMFMTKWELYKLVTPSVQTFVLDCGKPFKARFPPSSKTMHPCYLQINANASKFVMRKCEENHMICELSFGTLLGAVKLETVLPWDIDADIRLVSSYMKNFETLRNIFQTDGYRLRKLLDTSCCENNRTKGGAGMLSSLPYNVDMYGLYTLDSEGMIAQGIEPTRVLFDSMWLITQRNPGLFLRNRYGREIYRHALHWRTTGGTHQYITYRPDKFMSCSTPGHHDCLDRFHVDGNLQFTEVLP